MKKRNQIQNPIQYFEDLIYYRKLNTIKREFAQIDEEYGSVVSYDEETETLTYHEQDNETGKWEEWTDSFKDHIQKQVNDETIKSLKQVDDLMLNQDSFEGKIELANSIIENLFFLLDALESYPDAKKYEIIRKRLNNIIAHLQTKHSRLIGRKLSSKHKSITYVSPSRIDELAKVKSEDFDLAKLVRMLEELNIAYRNESYISCGIIIRTILDHIPPIFGMLNFTTLVSQYSGSTNKKLLENLQNSSRKIADSLLHSPIKRKEILPTETQIDSKRELDVLLGEIIIKLK